MKSLVSKRTLVAVSLMPLILSTTAGAQTQKPDQSQKATQTPDQSPKTTQKPDQIPKKVQVFPAKLEEIMEPGRDFAPNVPMEPEVRMAKERLRDIADKEAEWKSAVDRLDQALKSQSSQFSLFIEAETAKSLEEYAIKLKESGIELMNAYAELAKKNVELKGNLTRGPSYLRELANFYRKFAEAEQFQDVKEQYLKLEEVWTARADMMEKRGSSLDGFHDPQFYAYLKSWDQFLTVFIPTLQNYVIADGPYMEEFERFKKQLAEHVKRIHALSEAITKWRDAALKQSENEKIREEQQKDQERRIKTELDKMAAALWKTPKDYRYRIHDLPRWRAMPIGETVLVVRPNPIMDRLDYVARATISGDGRDLLIFDLEYEYSYSDAVLLPYASIPASVRCGPTLRHAQEVVNSNYAIALRKVADRETPRKKTGILALHSKR